MSIPFGHHELHNRYRFAGRLHLETPLRLSSGRASDLTDAPLMRDRAGHVFIPGTSLRGALRSAIERIIAGAGPTVGLRSCILFAEDDCNKKVKPQEENIRQESLSPAETEKRLLTMLEGTLCNVCKLFAMVSYALRLIVEDAYPQISQDDTQLKTAVRDGVGIDRDTGTARDGVKFDYEVLEIGPLFSFSMQVENMTDQDRQLVKLVIALLKQGVHVGGKQAAGLGKIKLEDTSLSVYGFENPQEMWKAIMAGKDPHQPLRWPS